LRLRGKERQLAVRIARAPTACARWPMRSRSPAA